MGFDDFSFGCGRCGAKGHHYVECQRMEFEDLRVQELVIRRRNGLNRTSFGSKSVKGRK